MRKLTGFNEGGTERDDLVVLVERDVRDGVRDGDPVVRLLDVDVRGGVAGEGGADDERVRGDVGARLHEGDRRILERGVGALRQRVVNTRPESLETAMC